jgi:putative drug exporter of the RND superfamily
MARLAAFVLHHRRWVMLFWLAMFIVGVGASGKATDRLTVDFSLPGQPGYETSVKILAQYGNGAAYQPYIPVVTVPAGTTVQAEQAKISAVFDEIQQTVPGVRVVDYAQTKDAVFLTKDGRTTYALVYAPPPKGFTGATPDQAIQPILDKAAAADGFAWSITGYDILARGTGGGSTGPSVLFETALGALGALAVLLFVFASFLALVPLLIAAVSILSTFTVVLLLTYVTDMSFIVQFLIALVGLGVAVDYSLLFVTRWREERDHGRTNEESVTIAMTTAGRAVVSSAGTVAISLISLLVLPVPFLRSMGLGGMLIPVVSTFVVLTLLPALLGGIGPRVDWPKIRHENNASRAWSGWARLIVRRRWWAAGAAAVLLGVLITPVFGIRIGQARTDSLASTGSAYTALQTLRAGGVPTGVVSPLEVLVQSSDPGSAASDAAAIVTTAGKVQGVSAAFAPDSPQWRKGSSALVAVIPTLETVDSTNAQVVNRVKTAVAGAAGFAGVSGAGAIVLDYIDAVYGNFPLVLGLIALVTFLLLARAFRSIVLAVKAVLLNIISVAATFGATTWFWQDGHGSNAIFGISGTGAITFWLPVLIFAFLFGLSMDYEVFILSRMREEYDRTGRTPAAVVEGLGRTGRLVTCAALILFLAFIALTSSPGTDIKVFATALGIGILLDATIVRALLVPALVSLFGRWNWWLPVPVARILMVEPHGAVVEPVDAPGEVVPAPA